MANEETFGGMTWGDAIEALSAARGWWMAGVALDALRALNERDEEIERLQNGILRIRPVGESLDDQMVMTSESNLAAKDAEIERLKTRIADNLRIYEPWRTEADNLLTRVAGQEQTILGLRAELAALRKVAEAVADAMLEPTDQHAEALGNLARPFFLARLAVRRRPANDDTLQEGQQ